MSRSHFSRRSFLTTGVSTALAVSGAASLAAKGKKIPLGLELYSVRDVLEKDLMGTVRTVARQGWETFEFSSILLFLDHRQGQASPQDCSTRSA